MHKQPVRGLRGIDDQLWEDLGTGAESIGSDRSAVARQLFEWWLGRPGAESPPRPRLTPQP